MGMQDKKVSLFSERRAGPEYMLDADSACGTPPKRHRKIWLLIILIVLAATVIFLSIAMSFNLFQLRDYVFSMLRKGEEASGSAQSAIADDSIEESSQWENSSLDTESPSKEPSEPSETSEPPAPTHGWVINQMGYTYLYEGYGIEQFNFTESTLKLFVDQMKQLDGKIKTTSHIFCMPIPTRISYFQSEIPVQVRREDNFFNSSQEDYLNALKNELPDRMKLIKLNDVFQFAYEQGNDPYFKSDKNWTADAAYLAYTQYCEMRKFTSVPIEEYKQVVKEGFLGSFYFATNSDTMQNNPEKFIYYQSEQTSKCTNTVYQRGLTFKNFCLADNLVSDVNDSYMTYLGTSRAHFNIKTEAGTGNRMLIIGDQSAAAMIPFLINHFNEIDYYDIDSGTGSIEDILSQHRYNDILVCAYMTNTVKGEFPGYMSSLLGMTTPEE